MEDVQGQTKKPRKPAKELLSSEPKKALKNEPKVDEQLATVRRRFKAALPMIAEALLAESLKGSVQHVRLAVDLGGLKKGQIALGVRKSRPKKDSATLALEMWEREKAALARMTAVAAVVGAGNGAGSSRFGVADDGVPEDGAEELITGGAGDGLVRDGEIKDGGGGEFGF